MKLNDKVLDRVNGGANTTANGGAGLPCPRCNAFIPTPLELIRKGEPVVCTHCGLTLEISKTGSRKAIDALRKVQAAIAEAERRQQEQ